MGSINDNIALNRNCKTHIFKNDLSTKDWLIPYMLLIFAQIEHIPTLEYLLFVEVLELARYDGDWVEAWISGFFR